MKHFHIITLKAAVLGALIATLGACATQSGPTYPECRAAVGHHRPGL
jgi:hypothetical protein